ncbi:MAG: murein hydrolase activator EnvC family protein, partial [Alphaproteobacteria bacterium]
MAGGLRPCSGQDARRTRRRILSHCATGRFLARLALVLALVSAAFPDFGRAADKPEKSGKRLQDVEQQLEHGRERETALSREAEALAREVEQIREKAITTARAAQDREDSISLLERRLDALNKEFSTRLTALGGQRVQLVRLLATLERIAILPPEALVARPVPPADTIRGALLLRAAIPTVEARGREIQTEIEALVALRKDIAARRVELAAALDGLQAERDRLGMLAERKEKLAQTREKERLTISKRNVRLAAEAKDLRELLERIEASRVRPSPAKPPPPTAERGGRSERTDRPERAEKSEPGPAERAESAVVASAAPSAIRAMSAARGQMLLPVRGTVVKAFGQEGGAASEKGITIETRPEAQVVAPFDGQIAFAGPFRGYGLILIIDHGDGYHSLLVGLSRIGGTEGQWVVAGEPVGLMGQLENAKP